MKSTGSTISIISKFVRRQWSLLSTLCLFLFIVFGLGTALPAAGQADDGWMDPLNLSRSGAATNPQIVVDTEGLVHVIWQDAYAGGDGFAGWVYSFYDGELWSEPVVVNFPFDIEDLVGQPEFASDGRGRVHAFWVDSEGSILYSWVNAARFGDSGSWAGTQVIAASALALEVVSDSLGDIHLAYIRPLQTIEAPAGAYYRRTANSGDSWLPVVNLYQSPYFRGLTQDSASVDIATALVGEEVSVYVTWDNRILKRAFFAKSDDGGASWGEAQQLIGPESILGLGVPYNIQISGNNDNVLILYQIGESGGVCTQYSQWSEDGGALWGMPVKIGDYPICPKTSQIIHQSDGQYIALFDVMEDMIFMVWNGIEWSEPQNQIQLSAFQNPDTFDSVIYRCRQVIVDGDTFLVVGCDQGIGGDIWFTSAPLGLIQDWFKSATGWGSLQTVASTPGSISTLSTSVGGGDDIHLFWVERTVSEVDDNNIAIQHAQWNGARWSIPNTIISGMGGEPQGLSAVYNDLGGIFLTWVNGEVGQMFFSRAPADRATISSEWTPAQLLFTTLSTTSSPDAIVDATGKILVVFAIPFNENRGIYLTVSEDLANTWSDPVQIFNAQSATWDLVDHPKIDLAVDGRLHLVFTRYSAQRQPIGLFYTQSSDGGMTWSELEEVSNRPVLWSEVISYDAQVVHRMWREKRASFYVNYHQLSLDGGQTWGQPLEVSYAEGVSASPALSMDPDGNIHFFQVTDPESLTLQHTKWDGSRWIRQEVIQLKLSSENSGSYSVASDITPTGNLSIFLSVQVLDPSVDAETRILSTWRLLEGLIREGQISPGLIPLPVEVVSASEEVSPTPTSESSLANVFDPAPPISKNMVGLLVVAVVLALSLGVGVYLIFRSRRS